MFCGNLLGAFLPVQLIYKGKTNQCHPSYNFPPDWDITRHWSNEETMIQYVNNIFVPYVEKIRELFNEDKPALVIIDNFKGKITEAMTELLESHRVHTCLTPPNIIDRLQPMDISVNKPAKSFLKKQFEMWYSHQVTQQLEGQDIETVAVAPIDLSMGMMKEIGAKWLVDMASYISDNPQFIVNGFIHAGITKALNGEDINDVIQKMLLLYHIHMRNLMMTMKTICSLISSYYNKLFTMIIMIMIMYDHLYNILNCNMSKLYVKQNYVQATTLILDVDGINPMQKSI